MKRKLIVAAMALTGLIAFCSIGTSASSAARHSVVICHATGGTWHMAEILPGTVGPNGEVIPHPASGDRYRYYSASEAFCKKSEPWIRRLTTGSPEAAGFENKTVGKLHIPTGYDLLPKDDSPPGYNCFATIDDPRPGHHHDNPHQGSCIGQTGNEHKLPPFTWFPVLPSE